MLLSRRRDGRARTARARLPAAGRRDRWASGPRGEWLRFWEWVPGLDEGSAKFDVNANRIRFRYDTRKEVKKRGSDVETSERVEKVLPLPPGADPSGFEVRKGKDEITLVFHRIEHGA
ncbi:MAG: hypothetical protein ACXVID_06975 [Thermoanaerobaculia bacterium]